MAAKKQNKLTFADKARKIEKSFPRRDFDKIEQRDFEQQMEKLIDEQEAYKKAHGMITDEEQGENVPESQEQEEYATGGYQLPYNLDTTTLATSNKPLSNIVPTNSSIQNQSFLPSYISAGTNIVGNLLSAAINKPMKEIVPRQYIPEKLNLTAEKEIAKREAEVGRNTLLHNLRVASTPGQYLSNIGAGTAGIQRNLGNILTDIGTKEQQYNTNVLNQARSQNTAEQLKADLINAEAEKRFKDEQLGFYQGAFSTIPETIKYINTQKADYANRDIYQKLLNYLGRNYKLDANLYGNNPFNLTVRP